MGRSLRESTANSTVALLLLIEFVNFSEIHFFCHFWVHNSVCYFFVFPFYLFQSDGSPAKVGAASLFTDCAEKAFVGAVMFKCFLSLFGGAWSKIFFDRTASSLYSFNYGFVFFL